MTDQGNATTTTQARANMARPGTPAATAAKSAASVAAPPPSRMTLAGVRKGRIVDHPMRVLLYAPEGIGKSTFAAGAPSPIFICPEDGTAQLDVARLPEPQSWPDVIEGVRLLGREDHDYKTLVIDTADWIEPFLWQFICARDHKADIEAYGFGKGYVAALEEWRKLIVDLDKLRAAKRMNVVILGHSQVKTFKNPEGEDFDRYTMKVHEKSGGLLREWVDAALFATHETFAVKADKAPKAKGFATGARVIHTERRAAWDAKNRYSLPETIPLGWQDFADAVAANDSTARDVALRAEIDALVVRLDDAAVTPHVATALAATAVGDTNKLSEMINRLIARISAKESPNV